MRYSPRMDREAARAFASRHWTEFERLRARERAVRFRKEGSRGTVRRSRALWQWVRSIRSGWPSEALRARDLVHHVELKRRIDRAARGFALR
jgi:hypothetical protein